jgi:hypothetical protein
VHGTSEYRNRVADFGEVADDAIISLPILSNLMKKKASMGVAPIRTLRVTFCVVRFLLA